VASRRDLILSYQFLTRRVIAAFVTREPDPDQSPLRKGVGAVFAGIMITILVGAGFGVYGLVTHKGSNAWQVDGAVVVEKETGASYVYAGGTLHPMLNFASALLAAGRTPPQTFTVPAASLAALPRAVRSGIAGAPGSLPPAAGVLRGGWALCALPDASTSLSVGRTDVGGNGLGDGALLVTDGVGTYLIWHGHRYGIVEAVTVVPSLYPVQQAPSRVGNAWLKGLPAGTDLAPVAVPDRGAASTVLPGRKVGDLVYAETGGGRQYYLVFPDGLAAISPLQRDIAVGVATVAEVPIPVADANRAAKSSRLPPPADPSVAAPDSPPHLVVPPAGAPLCARSTDARSAPQVWVGGSLSGLGSGLPVAGGGAGAALADRVAVPAGHVAIAAPSIAGGGYSLVTDEGIRYPVPAKAVLGLLGYPPDLAVSVPDRLLDRLPAGPALDPAAAGAPAG
jgi:type VII secretion protein EccB